MTGPWDDYAPTAPAAPAQTRALEPDEVMQGGQLYSRTSDGKTVPEVDVPAPQTTVPAAPTNSASAGPWNDYAPSAPAVPDPSTLKADDTLGFTQDFLKPGRNVLNWLSGVPVVGQGLDAISRTVNAGEGLKQAIGDYDNVIPDAAAHGRKPGIAGSLLGGVAGTLPTLMIGGPLAPLIQGAVGGALEGDGTLKGTALGAAGGAVLGHAVGTVGNALMNTFAPKVSDSVQTLIDAGMRRSLTPGMIAGKNSAFGVGESLAKVVPIVGEMQRSAGNDALVDFNKAMANRVAQGFGGQASGDTAEGLAQSVSAAKNAAYDIKTPSGVQLDPVYASQVGGIRAKVASLPESTGFPASFDSLVRDEIAARADPQTGVLSDAALKDAKNAISGEIANFRTDTSGWARKYVGHLKDLRGALTSNLGRADQGAADQLAQADANYPAYKVFQDALRRGTQNSTNEGNLFTPQQAQAAITRAYPDALASGAPLQDLVGAAKDVLPRKFQDVTSPWHAIPEALVASGVAGADVLHGHGGALTGAMLAGVPLATRFARSAVSSALLRTGAGRTALANTLGFDAPSALANLAGSGAGTYGGAPTGSAGLSGLEALRAVLAPQQAP